MVLDGRETVIVGVLGKKAVGPQGAVVYVAGPPPASPSGNQGG